MMTVNRGFKITLLSGLAGAAIGSGIGILLGRFSPDYYRVVFRLPDSMDLDPVQAGIGLGLTQGLGAGLIIGLVVVLAVTWYEVRSVGKRFEPGGAANESQPIRSDSNATPSAAGSRPLT